MSHTTSPADGLYVSFFCASRIFGKSSTGVSNVEFFMSRIQCINYVCLHCPVKPVFSAQTQMPCGESQALCDSSPWRPQALLDREVNKYWDLGTNQSMPSSHVLHSYIRRLKCMSHKTNLTQLKYELYSAHEKCDV